MAARNGGKGRRNGENASVKADWQCKSCTNRAGKPWRNAGSLTTCGSCHIHKGASFGQVVVRGPGESPTSSTRQREVAKESDVVKELAAMRAELKKANAANAKLEAAMAAGPSAASAAAGAPMEQDSDSDGTGSLNAAIAQARAKLKDVESLPESVRPYIGGEGGYDGLVTAARGELQSALAARRAANPLKKQLEGAEVHQQKMARRLADAKSFLQNREDERTQILKQIEIQKAAVVEAEDAVAKADAEVAGLAAKFASERAGGRR